MIKSIWNEFKAACASAWNSFVAGISSACKDSFIILKNGVVNFIKALFTWLWSILKGICLVAWSFIKVLWAAFVAAIKSTLGVVYNKLIDWVNKW